MKKKPIQIRKQNRKNYLCHKFFDKASIRKNLCRKVHFFGAPIRILLYPHYFMALRYIDKPKCHLFGQLEIINKSMLLGKTYYSHIRIKHFYKSQTQCILEQLLIGQLSLHHLSMPL